MPGVLLLCFAHGAEKIPEGRLMDRQELQQAFNGDVRFSFFNPPVLDQWQIVFQGELRDAVVSFLRSEVT
jgi:hypothetical protein